jgi:hypothetical protein
MIEVNPANNQVVFEANLTDTSSYRAFRAKFYDGFSSQNSNLTIKPIDTTRIGVERQTLLLLQRVKKKINSLEMWVKARFT